MNVNDIICSIAEQNIIGHIYSGDHFSKFYRSENDILEPVRVDELYYAVVADGEGNELVVRDSVNRFDSSTGKYYKILFNKEDGIHTRADTPAAAGVKFVPARTI